MFTLISQLFLAFLAGLLVKAVDWMDDTLHSKNPAKFFLAIFYGLIISYLIGSSTFGLLFLAALFAQVFARKIDTPAHGLGFIVAVLSLFFFGLPQLDLVLLAYFLVLAFMDELEYMGRLSFLNDFRLLLQAGALLLIFVGRYDYFIGILAFDVGYLLFDHISKKIVKAQGLAASK